MSLPRAHREALEDASFAPALLEVRERAPHPAARALPGAFLAMFAALLAWAALGELDIVAVAEGRLVPGSYLKIVQSAEAGVVQGILVAEGERVRAGQVLVRMDAVASEADRRALEADYDAKRLALRRIDALLAGRPLAREPGDPPALFERVAAQHAAELRADEGAAARERTTIERARQELAAARELRAKLIEVLPHYVERERAFASLVREGYAGRLMGAEKTRERIEKQRDLEVQQAVIRAARASLAEAQARLQQLDAERLRRLHTERVAVSAELDRLAEQRAKQSHRGELLVLRAPQDAIVKELATHTPGTVVSPGTVLMTLVPERDVLRAEVWVRHDDIGFVRPGQPVRLKFAAYPFQKYGMAEGRIAQLGADASQAGSAADAPAGYRALIDLTSERLEGARGAHALTPGMALSAEIRLGTRSVLEYVLSPVQRAAHEAGRER